MKGGAPCERLQVRLHRSQAAQKPGCTKATGCNPPTELMALWIGSSDREINDRISILWGVGYARVGGVRGGGMVEASKSGPHFGVGGYGWSGLEVAW